MSGRLRRALLFAWCVAVLVFWAATIWRSGGLFAGSFSVDYRSFWAATQAFLTAGPAAAYDMPTLNRIIQQLGGTGGAIAGSLVAAPAPYPPPFFLIFAPFALVAPALGYVLWTLFNLALSIAAVWPLVRTSSAPWRALWAALLFFPLAFSLYAGQPSGLLLLPFTRHIEHCSAKEEMKAGLWLGVLLLKPQYAFGLVLVLLWKRRWRTIAGVTAAGVLVAAASLALIGVQGLLAYRSMLSSVAGFRSAPAGIAPNIMISWRGFLLNVLPELTDRTGLLLTLVCSALTVLCLPFLWRGPWRPRDAAFSTRFFATMVVTLLAAYHSHIYGATLLLVPGAQLAIHAEHPVVRRLLLVGLLAPPFVLLFSGSTIAVAMVTVVLMTATLATILAGAVTRRKVLPTSTDYEGTPVGASALQRL